MLTTGKLSIMRLEGNFSPVITTAPAASFTEPGQIDWPPFCQRQFRDRRLYIEGLIAYRLACGEEAEDQ